MRQTHPLFVGYPTLEGWIGTRDRARPVLALNLVEAGREDGGMRTDTLLVVCQQVDADGTVHYCRLRAASLARCFGEPFDTDWRDREAAWQSLWQEVEGELARAGLTVCRATVAAPDGLRYLEGSAGSIMFVPETRRFVRRAA